MIASSRPLRFLALLVGAWVTMRAAQLWPVTHPVVAGIPALLETIVSRVARPVAAVGTASIDLGLGAWGGAQRGAARLDVGPTASASVPVGGKTVRVSVDWRHRVAGDARPGSGPALSIGTDF